jgi:hypothetical protein
VVRARVDCVIQMPAMPGMPKYSGMAHAEDVPGEYGVHPTFAHGGEYLLQVTVAPPEDQPFQVEFPLHVRDAEEARKHKPRPARYQVEISSVPKTPKAGERAEIQITIRDREGPGAVVATFERMHEKLLHLVIVRSDLSYFAHEHPEIMPDGTFRLNYVFSAGGEYRLFAECAPRNAGAQVIMTKLRVSGKTPARFDIAKLTRAQVWQTGEVRISLQNGSAPIPPRKMVPLGFSLTDASTGAPIRDLESYLGAQAHLILIHQNGETFVHSHPGESDGALPFLARFPKPGRYRGWLQFQRNGVVVTSAFLVEAGASE